MIGVLLVHGMGRTPLSWALLAARLRPHAFRPHFFGYLAAIESVDTIVARLRRRLGRMARRPYLAVGHSLGGLFLRAALADCAGPLPERLLLLGTPNQSPRLARMLLPFAAFRWAFGDSGYLLASPDRLAALPLPTVPTTIIAGTAGPRGRFSPFGDDANDGIVAVNESTLAGATVVTVPVWHGLMMNAPEVARWIVAQMGQTPGGSPGFVG